MNYQIIDLLDKAIDQNLEDDKAILTKEGVLTFNNQISINKLNLMSGEYTSKLIDNIIEADMNSQEVLEYIESLLQQNQYMGIYYFLLNLITALEMDIPYLYMQLPSNLNVLQLYIIEMISDMKECVY
jgi:hypothetical protein